MDKSKKMRQKCKILLSILVDVIKIFFLPKNNNGIIFMTSDCSYTGAPILNLNIVKSLSASNKNIVVLCLVGGDLENEFKQNCKILIKNPQRIIFKFLRMKKYSKIYISSVSSGMVLDYMNDLGYYIVSLIHEMPTYIKEHNLISQAISIAKYSNVVWFHTKFNYALFIQNFGEVKGKIAIKPHGIFLQKPKNLNSAKKKYLNFCKKFNILAKSKFLICVGTGDKRKGLDLFIDMAQKWEKANVLFIWIGKILDNTIINNFILIHKKLPQNLLFVGEIKDKDLLYEIYHNAMAMCLMSREDPFPSVVIESMSIGTPVLAFNGCGGYTEIIKDNVNGFLIPPFDLNIYSSKIKFLQDKEKRKAISKKAKMATKCDFDMEKFVEYLKTL